VRQAGEEEAAERAARDNASLDTQAEVSEAHARLLALEAQFSVIRGQALPATSRSMEALSAAFSTGNASLLEWVDVARSLLDLEMEMVVLHGDLQRGVASLERAVGTALPRTPLHEDSTP
jgi:outer membrane protein TolC